MRETFEVLLSLGSQPVTVAIAVAVVAVVVTTALRLDFWRNSRLVVGREVSRRCSRATRSGTDGRSVRTVD